LPKRVGFLHQLVDYLAGYKLIYFHRTLLGLYLAERILVDDLSVDRIVHELPCELDPFVDRRRGHSAVVTTEDTRDSYELTTESMHTALRLARVCPREIIASVNLSAAVPHSDPGQLMLVYSPVRNSATTRPSLRSCNLLPLT
jgi:hypothetical protein